MKQSLTILSIVFSALSIHAQVTSITSIRVGATTLVGSSLIAEQNNHGAPEMMYRPTLTYSGGLVANVNWYDYLGLQIEGSYAFQGQMYVGIQSDVDTEIDIKLNYIKIPVMFKYTFTDYSMSQNAPNLFFLFGPQFSFLQNASISYFRNENLTFEEYHETIYNPIESLHPEYTNDIDLFNGLDLSIATGFGAEFVLTDYLILTAEARLNIGLSDINAREWRFPDLRNNYTASRNYLSGLKIGVIGTIW